MAGPDVEQEEDAFDAKVKAEADQRIGLVVGGKYRIVRALGVGGMGAVYEAEHELIGKRVALKCLHPEYSRDRDLIERFKREARAATAIGNEHIVDVTDMGDLPDGAPFLVMEMLKGQALADLLDKEGVLPIGRSVKIIRQICFALAAAHEKGIVHRDMKPENVFLATRSEGRDFVKVLDFGISKMHEHGVTDRGLTRTGIAMGTPSYMSPEQAQGAKDVDARTDIWAVGVMLYELLTLRRPFEADSYPMMLMAIVSRDPESVRVHRKDVPEELDQVILRTLIKPVGLRTQTMRDFAEQLLPFVGLDGAPELTGEARSSAETPSPNETRALRGQSAGSAPGDAKSLVLDADGAVVGTAGTMVAGSAAPPSPNGAAPSEAGPSEAGRAVRQATPVTRAGERPRSEPPSASGPSSAARKNQTGELGTVERPSQGDARRGREATSSGAAVPMRGGSSLYIGLGALAIAALSVGAYFLQGRPPEPTPPAAVAPPVPPPVTPPVEPPSVPVAPAPSEVMVQITTTPPDARIEIQDVEFPNPLSAHRPRSLDPVTIRISADGYETIERLAIFDHEQSFVFQLSRGRGVRREGMDGRVREAHEAPHETGAPSTETPRETAPVDPPSGGFREEF